MNAIGSLPFSRFEPWSQYRVKLELTLAYFAGGWAVDQLSVVMKYRTRR
ncbi:hypothetical protein [Rhizobium favelukesii]|nr:hypothetical protein [Rhizobium favelukesii]MCS0461149.1 hypothetical protein [Rhizobium favelukesii]